MAIHARKFLSFPRGSSVLFYMLPFPITQQNKCCYNVPAVIMVNGEGVSDGGGGSAGHFLEARSGPGHNLFVQREQQDSKHDCREVRPSGFNRSGMLKVAALALYFN